LLAGSLLGTAVLSIGLLGTVISAGAARSAPPPETFPAPETFRTLQLTTYACGRENTASSCDRARQLADPLLDHPRLPASCKDVLWRIRQKAVVSPANSFERRDPIDAAASDVTVFCRQLPKTKSDAKPDKSGQGIGGLRLIEPAAP
jgi:hypothetical protein